MKKKSVSYYSNNAFLWDYVANLFIYLYLHLWAHLLNMVPTLEILFYLLRHF